ncbi:hypothetical protein FDECE_8843 [Fusarium decemcellulare]|nr:hypothetical protein FDECE_8843 [Fusarium decemcellulare]
MANPPPPPSDLSNISNPTSTFTHYMTAHHDHKDLVGNKVAETRALYDNHLQAQHQAPTYPQSSPVRHHGQATAYFPPIATHQVQAAVGQPVPNGQQPIPSGPPSHCQYTQAPPAPQHFAIPPIPATAQNHVGQTLHAQVSTAPPPAVPSFSIPVPAVTNMPSPVPPPAHTPIPAPLATPVPSNYGAVNPRAQAEDAWLQAGLEWHDLATRFGAAEVRFRAAEAQMAALGIPCNAEKLLRLAASRK